MVRESLDFVLKYIMDRNSNTGLQCIPHSDQLYREISSTHGLSKEEIDDVIELLKEAHRILVFEIVKKDKTRNIEAVYGYIEADLVTVRQMEDFFQREAANGYEEEYGTRLPPHQALRELFNKMHLINNTPLGHLANKAIMLGEFETMLEKNYLEYSPQWKERKTEELIRSYKGILWKQPGKSIPGEGVIIEDLDRFPKKRAVDSIGSDDFTSEKGRQSLNRLLSIYGVEFFFKINLRKYSFDYVRKVVESGEINKKSDLELLKKMLQKIRNNIEKDAGLAEHFDEIMKLERCLSRALFRSKY